MLRNKSKQSGESGAWRKVAAAYRRVYDSRHLQVDCCTLFLFVCFQFFFYNALMNEVAQNRN